MNTLKLATVYSLAVFALLTAASCTEEQASVDEETTEETTEATTEATTEEATVEETTEVVAEAPLETPKAPQAATEAPVNSTPPPAQEQITAPSPVAPPPPPMLPAAQEAKAAAEMCAPLAAFKVGNGYVCGEATPEMKLNAQQAAYNAARGVTEAHGAGE